MNDRMAIQMILPGLAVLVSAMVLQAPAQSRGYGAPIQFSTPRQEAATTNLNEFTDPSRSSLRRLEDDLNKPLRVLGRDSDAEMFVPRSRPPAGPVIQSKRIRELLDRRKNWVFDTPENQLLGLTEESPLKVPELDDQGRDSSKMSVFERFYQNLEQSGNTNPALSGLEFPPMMDNSSGLRPFDTPETGAAQAAPNREELTLPSIFYNNSFQESREPGSGGPTTTANLFAPGSPNSWQNKAQEVRLQQFKQLMQRETPKATAPALPGLTGSREMGGSIAPPQPTGSSLDSRVLRVPGASGFSGAGLAAAPGLASPAAQPTLAPPPPEPRRPKPSPLNEMPRRNF